MSRIVSVISDIHLDLVPDYQVTEIIHQICTQRTGQTLLLAGDVASPHTTKGRECLQLLYEATSKKFKDTLMVMGNHEHYDCQDMNTTKELLTSFGYQVLDHDIWTNGHIKIAGCTLWSEIPKAQLFSCWGFLNDFECIRIDGKKLTPMTYNGLHKVDKEWLETVSDVDLVVTHHAPLYEKGCSSPEFQGKKTNCCFETNLENLVSQHKKWVCGHTHHRNRFMHGDCEIIVNCLGYLHEHVGLVVENIKLGS